MSNLVSTAAAALIGAVISIILGAKLVFNFARVALRLLFWMFVLGPFCATRRRLFGESAVLRRRINAARLIA